MVDKISFIKMNSEEIYLDEDLDTILASGPLPVIPNAQDVQVAAAAALSSFDSQSESESDESDDEFEQATERDDVVMNEFVSLDIKLLEDREGGDVQDAPRVQVELKSIPVADRVLLEDEESEETSSDEDEDNMYGDDDVEEIATYGELKSMLDSMTRDNDVAAPVPTAAELLFTESIQSFDNLVIDENDAVSLAGHVISRLEGTIVVKASKDSQVLDEGSILVTNGKKLLGPVEDIFGPVQTPMYILRDPSALGIEDCGIIAEIGDAVYSLDKLSKPVAEEEMLRVKGYDSDDVEGVETKPDVECEFSDDEAVRFCIPYVALLLLNLLTNFFSSSLLHRRKLRIEGA